MNNNKFQSSNKYFTICVYVIIVILIGSLIVKNVFDWNATSGILGKYLSALSTFLIGFFIAYLLNPIVKFMNKKFFSDICHIRSNKLSIALSILVSYLLVIGLIVIIILYIVPQVIGSITDLSMQIPDWSTKVYNDTIAFITKFENENPDFDYSYIENVVNKYLPNIFSITNITNATNFISTLIPKIFVTSMSIIKGVMNFVIAIIISCYMLIDKNYISLSIRKLLFAIFPSGISKSIIVTAKECNDIFSGYIAGKTLDSFIIGILCFIGMSILKLPYTVLISIIIGVTNMIPYFGPYFGCIPGALIIVMFSPIKVIIYLILILVIQQFDGLYLGPKILGDSTGLRPIWILFAITLGGAVAGVIGMFLGVPVVAVIAHLVNKWINARLTKKEITVSDIEEITEQNLSTVQKKNPVSSFQFLKKFTDKYSKKKDDIHK